MSLARTSSEDHILASLNQAQRRAVSSDASTLAILAGPGSGKTHTLTSRVVWLLDAAGYQPQNIIVATFTVKAAREMKERIGRALNHDGRERKLVLGTFHSIARRYLAAYGSRISLDPKFSIADESDSRGILTRLCKRLQLGVEPARARAWISKQKAKGIDGDLSPHKQGRSRKADEAARDLQTCYDEYQAQLKQSNLLDYDDLLLYAVELLRAHPDCVRNVQTVLVDEYQDTNGVQYQLMKLLAQRQRRITVVGDPDQSIYGWRSAEVRNLHRLLRDYPGTDQVALEDNYRSSQRILDAALCVIQQDEKRYKKVLKPTHDRGTQPVLRRLKTPAAEADWIVSEIKRVMMLTGKMLTCDDVAILLRSAALSRHVEAALGRAGMAYRMVGGFKFYERLEIKTLLDYLRVINMPDNNDALARVVNVPKRGIGETTVKALIEEAETSSLSLWSLLSKHCRGDRLAKTNIKKQTEQKLSGEVIRLINGLRKRIDESSSENPVSLVELIENLLVKLKYQQYLRETHPQDHEQRWANVQEFVNLAADFVMSNSDADDGADSNDDALPQVEGVEQREDTGILARFLANVSLASDAQTKEDGQEHKAHVTISTIHAAKGLEWPIVFVPAAYNGSIPHIRADDSDEERRLLYVAMTRAQALLYLSCPVFATHEGSQKHQLSPFLESSTRSLAKSGPDLERYRVEGIASILRRTPPSQDDIYKSLPSMTTPLDDLFPEDPEAQIQHREDETASGRYAAQHRAKRAKLAATSGGMESTENHMSSEMDYNTTMGTSSSFTMSSFQGFTTAQAYQTTLSTSSNLNQNNASSEDVANARGVKRSSSKRPVDQSSMLAFLQGKPSSTLNQPQAETEPGPSVQSAPSFSAQRHAAMASRMNQRPPKPAIDPSLTAHKLGSHAARATKPPLPSSKAEIQENQDGDRAADTRRPYAQFSSPPPPGPASPESKRSSDANKTDTSAPASGTAQGEAPTARPAACFHSTTVTRPNGMQGGFKRPPGLPREGLKPMDTLKKPFKPLTIKRP